MARVPYLSQDDLPAEYRHLLETDPDDPADVVARIHRAWANNPTLYAAWGEWATIIYDEMADTRLRELVILAVADICDCAYVWHQHVPLAREVGMDDRAMVSIRDSELGGFTAAEQAAVRYARTHVTNAVTDEVHSRLREHFSDSEIITLSVASAIVSLVFGNRDRIESP